MSNSSQRQTEVYCSKCAGWVDCESMVFLDIEEDITGRDLVTFVCKWCGDTNKSFVRTR